jgi:hypothetical protein
MNRTFMTAFVVGSMCLIAPPSTRGGDAISSDEFKQIRNLVKPDVSEERWAQIPWLTSLSEARKHAAAKGKPILLWEMDGHPLGCT